MHRETALYVALIRTNFVLSGVGIFLALYLLVFPFWPQVTYWIDQKTETNRGIVYKGQAARAAGLSIEEMAKLQDKPTDNRLVIPKIGIDAPIAIDSKKGEAFEKGIWRRPNTSTPDLGGNTVLVAHRFLYTSGSHTFYHLDKLSKDDRFTVYWEGKEYTYVVTERFEVSPDQIEIENTSPDPIITLYTCTPIFTADKRLVVRARLDSVL